MTEPQSYDFNDWLNPSPPTPETAHTAANGHTAVDTTDPRVAAYTQAAINDELQILAGTPEGQRNNQLNRATFKLGTLVAAGVCDEHAIAEQLHAVATQIGSEPAEIRGTLRSGMRAGKKHPRNIQLRPQATPLTTPAATPTPAEDDAARPRTTWWPQPIAERAQQAEEEPDPTHLYRDDGHALLYTGKVNGLIGESESGKTWIALLAVTQALNAGQRILILDFEDSPTSVYRRLTALGAQQLQHVDYANPQEALGLIQTEDLQEALTNQYQMILADGVNVAMSLLGYELLSNDDATAFAIRFLRPLAATGACVTTVDHVPKNPETRGKGGIGAQAKRAMMDGANILVEITVPFGKGQTGAMRLTVDKDRNGKVRGISAGGKYIGKAHLESIGETVNLHISAPEGASTPGEERPRWQPTTVMEKASRLLEGAAQPLSGNEIYEALQGRRQTVLQAIAELVAGGFVHAERRSGRGGGDVYRSLKPYRVEVVPTGSQPVPGTGIESGSHPPPPLRGWEPLTRPPGTTSEPGPREPLRLDIPDGHSSCNHCGTPTPDNVIDDTGGYCRPCARLWGGGA